MGSRLKGSRGSSLTKGAAEPAAEAEGGFSGGYWGVAPSPIQGTFLKSPLKTLKNFGRMGGFAPPDFLLKRGRHAHRFSFDFCRDVNLSDIAKEDHPALSIVP